MLRELTRRMDTTILKAFPAHRLDEARETLKKAHARLVRSAAKTGQEAPSAPELVILAERIESRCLLCQTTVEGFPPNGHKCIEGGVWESRTLVDLEIAVAPPALAGWEFLAVIEPLEGGNLLRQVPGARIAEGELAAWRQGSIQCDHCHTTRRRTETFIVRADGSDPAIPAGMYQQVGRNCLGAFLGGKSPAAILALLAYPDLIKDVGADEDGGWGGGSGMRVFHPEIFLAQTAACIRLAGWVSRGQAREKEGVQATADYVSYLLSPPSQGDRRWQQEVLRCKPTPEDIEQGRAALAWARSLTPASDYENNLVLVTTQPCVKSKHKGILASVVPAHTRVLSQNMAQKHATTGNESQHVGKIGERLSLSLEVQGVHSLETEYGPLHIISMRDPNGNRFIWKTGSVLLKPGERVHGQGTVKQHDEYRGEHQTILSRCKLKPVAVG